MSSFTKTPGLICSPLLLGLIFLSGAGWQARAQGLKITDADVSLNDTAGTREAPASSTHPAARSPGLTRGGTARARDGADAALAGRAPLGGPRREEAAGAKVLRFTGYSRSRLESAVYREAARYRIDPALIFALIEQESGFKVGAVSLKGARGPLQLMPATAARFGVRNPYDPDEAVRGGVAYVVWLLDRFGGDVSLALAGYNAGEGAVEAYLTGRTITGRGGKVINPRGIRTGGIPPYEETRNYVRQIAGRYRRIKSQAAESERR